MKKEFKRAKLITGHPRHNHTQEMGEEPIKANWEWEDPEDAGSSREHRGQSDGDEAKLEIDEHGNILGEAAELTEHAEGKASAKSENGIPVRAARRSGRGKHEVHDESGSDREPEGNKQSKMEAETNLTEEELELKKDTRISPSFERLKHQLEEQVGLNKSFDVVFREMTFGGQLTGVFYYNGFAKDTVLTDILTRLSYADEEHRADSETRSFSGQREGREHWDRERTRELEQGEREDGHWPGDEGRNPGQAARRGTESRGPEHASEEEGDRTEYHREEKAGRHQNRKPDKLKIIELFDHALIPHIQVKKTDKLKEVIDNVAMGCTAFFFEGEHEAVLVDAKNFPMRTTEEPDLERVVRGSRDGFVETLLTNVTLVRRRLRDPRLKLEITQVGKRTQTDVCIGYIQDICDMEMVESVRDKIKQVNVDGLPLAEKQLEEAIIGKGWNPYPSVRYSERPDVVAAHMLEGHVAIFVDTSPSVMILPTTFFHHVQHAEEYRQTPLVGSYLRWVRFMGIAASLFLLPLWFLIVTSPELKPAGLDFIGPQKDGKIPMILQFLIAELGIDLMRMAAIHTPTPLATAMGLVAAILIGDVAVKTGLFVNEVILYLSVAAIGTFATPSYELSLANRLSRLVLLVAAAIFKVPGLVIASTALVIMLALQRSYNTPYLWPFLPFNAKAMLDILVRRPFLTMKTRMSLTKPVDATRQSPEPPS